VNKTLFSLVLLFVATTAIVGQQIFEAPEPDPISLALLSALPQVPELPMSIDSPLDVLPPVDVTIGDEQQSTKTFQLHNADVKSVASSLNTFVLSKQPSLTEDGMPKLDGFVVAAPILLLPDHVTNSLTVTAEESIVKEVGDTIKALDTPPAMIMVKAKLVQVDASGSETVVCRPQVMTLHGQKATIEIGQANGERIRLELTPYLTHGED